MNKKLRRAEAQFSSSSSHLPEEIILEILVRVPPQQITRLKAVCKQWHLLISDPTFVNSHLRQQHIILTTFSDPDNIRHVGHFIVSRESDTKPDDSIFTVDMQHMHLNNLHLNSAIPSLQLSVKSCCDGLVLLVDQHHKPYIYNPVARTNRPLPDPIDDHDQLGRVYNWILFFDNTVGKYKVSGLLYYDVENCRCIVHTVGEHDWTQTEYLDNIWPMSPPIHVDKELHWVALNVTECGTKDCNPCFIISMGLDARKRGQINLPKEQPEQPRYLSLVKGSLCLTSFSCDKLDIIVLKDRAQSIWAKAYRVSLQSLPNLPSTLNSFLADNVCVVGGRDVDGCDYSGLVKIFVSHENQLMCYDLNLQEFKKIGPLTLSKNQFLRGSYHSFSGSLAGV